MKKILILFLIVCYSQQTWSQDEVNFEFSDGINNPALKQRMERQMSMLLTAINKAESSGGMINFNGIEIDPVASQSITAHWEIAHFRCLDDDIVEHCLSLKRNGRVYGYQIRNIAVEMKPMDDSYKDDPNQEVCINFDTKGVISDFNFTMGITQYTRLMKEGAEIGDIDEREQVIHFCEQFKNAYIKKDISFMENIFSDDALIITGKVIMRKKAEVQMSQKDYEYTSKTKAEYLKGLKALFNNPKVGAINVNFKDYRIKRHGSKPNYYGVTLIQDWSHNTYSDQGIVFLVWDFTDKEMPKIQVRTWQPLETDEDEIFTLKRFKLR
ncbi:MAG: hypothetical protein K2M96_04515 [Prevotella sp.]|nr:hypothetical protein [Prevotella sp.]